MLLPSDQGSLRASSTQRLSSARVVETKNDHNPQVARNTQNISTKSPGKGRINDISMTQLKTVDFPRHPPTIDIKSKLNTPIIPSSTISNLLQRLSVFRRSTCEPFTQQRIVESGSKLAKGYVFNQATSNLLSFKQARTSCIAASKETSSSSAVPQTTYDHQSPYRDFSERKNSRNNISTAGGSHCNEEGEGVRFRQSERVKSLHAILNVGMMSTTAKKTMEIARRGSMVSQQKISLPVAAAVLNQYESHNQTLSQSSDLLVQEHYPTHRQQQVQQQQQKSLLKQQEQLLQYQVQQQQQQQLQSFLAPQVFTSRSLIPRFVHKKKKEIFMLSTSEIIADKLVSGGQVQQQQQQHRKLTEHSNIQLSEQSMNRQKEQPQLEEKKTVAMNNPKSKKMKRVIPPTPPSPRIHTYREAAAFIDTQSLRLRGKSSSMSHVMSSSVYTYSSKNESFVKLVGEESEAASVAANSSAADIRLQDIAQNNFLGGGGAGSALTTTSSRLFIKQRGSLNSTRRSHAKVASTSVSTCLAMNSSASCKTHNFVKELASQIGQSFENSEGYSPWVWGDQPESKLDGDIESEDYVSMMQEQKYSQ